MERALWSPSRVKAALQCGRRLQGKEENWPRQEHIRGIRGSAVHRAVEAWEDSSRQLPVPHVVTTAWQEILAESPIAGVDHAELIELLFGVWNVEGEISLEEDVVAERLSDRYKAPRRTKDFAKQTAHLDDARAETRALRVQIEHLIASVTWPWESERGILAEGFDHSLETVRRGTDYLAELWPAPDIVRAEWNLTSTLPNGYRVHGYIDRVEASAGVEIVDYKSSEYQDTHLDHFLQVATYAVIAEDHMGFPADRARLLYLRDQKSTTFEIQPSWRQSLAHLVEAADRVLADKAFAPTFAGCGICAYFPICDKEFSLVPIEEKEAVPA